MARLNRLLRSIYVMWHIELKLDWLFTMTEKNDGKKRRIFFSVEIHLIWLLFDKFKYSVLFIEQLPSLTSMLDFLGVFFFISCFGW